jgi:hypothetical protein
MAHRHCTAYSVAQHEMLTACARWSVCVLQLFHPDQGVAKHGKEAVEAALLARWKTVAGVKKAYKDIYP